MYIRVETVACTLYRTHTNDLNMSFRIKVMRFGANKRADDIYPKIPKPLLCLFSFGNMIKVGATLQEY